MTSFLQTSGVQYNSFACSTTHTQLTDSRSGYFPVARYGDYLVCERVKWDVEMGWSRRNWTGNFKIAKFKELMWQISLNRGGWVMGRKNWMSLRVSFRLTQTRWSSRQKREDGKCLGEREAPSGWEALRDGPFAVLPQLGATMKALEKGLWPAPKGFGLQESKGSGVAGSERGWAVGWVWRSLLNWPLWNGWTWTLASHHLLATLLKYTEKGKISYILSVHMHC